MIGIVQNSVREKLARGEVVAFMTARLVRGVEIAAIAPEYIARVLDGGAK